MPLNIFFAAVVGGLVPASYELINFAGFVLIAIGAPALSAVYLYLLVKLARSVSMPTLALLAGRNSLSCYVAQGVVAGFIFGAYGLGLFNDIGQAMMLPLSVLIALTTAIVVGLYARYRNRGPLEQWLRFFTGGRV